MEELDFDQFITFIKMKTNIDLAQYKEVQMKRRLTTLRDKRGFSSFKQYSEALVNDKQLLVELLDRITINVTEFFRNPARWEVLYNRFLPELIQQSTSSKLKVWSAACSTGEEPYTLAMLLHELQVLQRSELHATDLDIQALQKAQEAIYVDRSLRDTPPAYVQRYFVEEDGQYRITDKLKQAIIFRQQNLLADTFERNFDLIVCRNVMIYFTEEAKTILYTKFAEALKPGGILFVGSTEQIFSPALFGLETADTFFYRKL
ncbi:CheR family methyltransferase [Paenibacillus yanchengensis]|uniref:protein-glutamate O-methyltransferase n=1 Tax=Paenibacillus yanchengensis TaxID=2035833 RepID=A0ABW4YJU9_9BACL